MVASVIKTSHLRVYVPADRLDPLPEADGVMLGPPRDVTFAIAAVPMSDDAFVADWHGRRYLCPRTPRLRMLEGVLAVRHAYTHLGADAVIPERVAAAARAELERLHHESPALRAHILTSAWHVPIRWFVPFLTATKEIVGGRESVRIRYRCDQREAMANLDWAVAALSAAEPMEHVVSEVRELRRWLGEFPTTSMVELDYGTVASMFSESDLVMDDSAAEIRHALHALERGNVASAVRKYHRVATRWAGSLAISSSN
jgi:hypothetical protein